MAQRWSQCKIACQIDVFCCGWITWTECRIAWMTYREVSWDLDLWKRVKLDSFLLVEEISSCIENSLVADKMTCIFLEIRSFAPINRQFLIFDSMPGLSNVENSFKNFFDLGPNFGYIKCSKPKMKEMFIELLILRNDKLLKLNSAFHEKYQYPLMLFLHVLKLNCNNLLRYM